MGYTSSDDLGPKLTDEQKRRIDALEEEMRDEPSYWAFSIHKPTPFNVTNFLNEKGRKYYAEHLEIILAEPIKAEGV